MSTKAAHCFYPCYPWFTFFDLWREVARHHRPHVRLAQVVQSPGLGALDELMEKDRVVAQLQVLVEEKFVAPFLLHARSESPPRNAVAPIDCGHIARTRQNRTGFGVSDLSTLATSACSRRSRGPEQKTLRREFTSGCRTAFSEHMNK